MCMKYLRMKDRMQPSWEKMDRKPEKQHVRIRQSAAVASASYPYFNHYMKKSKAKTQNNDQIS